MAGRRSDNSTPSSTDVKNMWRYTSSSQMPSWHGTRTNLLSPWKKHLLKRWHLFRLLRIPCLCKTHSIISCSQDPATGSLLLQTNPVHNLKLQFISLRTWKCVGISLFYVLYDTPNI